MLTWLCFPWLIDRSRLPALIVFGLLGSALSSVQDRLVLLHKLWEYHDTGPLGDHAQIATLISLSAAPIFGMRFAQGLTVGGTAPWRRIAKFTAISMLPEIAGFFTGNIKYYNGWNLAWSVLAYIPIWLSFWGLHRWLSKAAPLSASSATEQKTAPGMH